MFLRSTDIQALPEEAKRHFLNSKATRHTKSLGDAAGLKNLGVHWVRVEAGDDSTEFHVHHYEEECVYIIAGTATAILGDESFSVMAGDFIAYPCNGVPHKIVNHSSEPLIYLLVGERRAHDISDYPAAGKRLYRNTGRWDLVDLMAIDDPRKKLPR
ncbi:MAG: cupin domain-containing protein [Gammaproteobacteria bacterium]|nr:cupin domain-containing protein [Gammaproteobacteria bacterium]